MYSAGLDMQGLNGLINPQQGLGMHNDMSTNMNPIGYQDMSMGGPAGLTTPGVGSSPFQRDPGDYSNYVPGGSINALIGMEDNNIFQPPDRDVFAPNPGIGGGPTFGPTPDFSAPPGGPPPNQLPPNVVSPIPDPGIGVGDGDSGVGGGNGGLPPAQTPNPPSSPVPADPALREANGQLMEYTRYGRDGGEKDFGLTPTGNGSSGNAGKAGQGGVDLQALLRNLGL